MTGREVPETPIRCPIIYRAGLKAKIEQNIACYDDLETDHKGMKQNVPKSVDEYIAAQPEVLRSKLEQVRATIRKAVPEAVEGIGYRMPGYKLHGKPMLYFAGFKAHYSLFAASGTFFAALEDELRGYELRKGTVHFPLTKPVPVKLISRIAKLRAAGIADTVKKPLLGRERKAQLEPDCRVSLGHTLPRHLTPHARTAVLAARRPGITKRWAHGIAQRVSSFAWNN